VLNTADGAAATMTVANLNLSGSGRLAMDWGDMLTTTGAATTGGNIALIPNGAFTSGTAYTFLQAASGLNGASYLIGNANNFTPTITIAPTSVTVTPTAATALSTAYWYGNQVTSAPAAMNLSTTAISNWSTSSGGLATTSLVPGATTDVIFSATGASQESSIVPGASMSVNSLTFNDTTPVTINADGSVVTVMGGGIAANQNATINAGLGLGAAQTWSVASGMTLTVGGPITGGTAATLNVAGPGTVLLTGLNSYSGSTSIASGGTLQIGGAGVLGGGSYAKAISNSGTFVMNSSANQTLGGVISGGGSLYQIGSGQTTLSALNTYSGATTVSHGTLTLQNGNSSAGDLANSAITVNAGGELDLNFNDALGYGNTKALTVYGTVKKTNAQSETLYRPITLSGGTLTSTTVGAGSGATGGGAWNFFGNYIAAAPSTSNYITGVGQFSLRTASCYFTTGANSSLTISVPISEDGGATAPLWTQGSGTVILTGSNLYSGATNISGGTLQLGNGQAGYDGSINATSGVTVNAGGELAFDLAGIRTASYAISGSGSLAMIGPGQLTLSGTNSYTGGTVVSNGTMVVTNNLAIEDGTSLTVGNPAAFAAPIVPSPVVGGAVATTASAPTIAPVPEPGTLALLAAGVAAAMVAVRRRNQFRNCARP
jgi:autotransporter-associated beta strand protein